MGVHSRKASANDANKRGNDEKLQQTMGKGHGRKRNRKQVEVDIFITGSNLFSYWHLISFLSGEHSVHSSMQVAGPSTGWLVAGGRGGGLLVVFRILLLLIVLKGRKAQAESLKAGLHVRPAALLRLGVHGHAAGAAVVGRLHAGQLVVQLLRARHDGQPIVGWIAAATAAATTTTTAARRRRAVAAGRASATGGQREAGARVRPRERSAQVVHRGRLVVHVQRGGSVAGCRAQDRMLVGVGGRAGHQQVAALGVLRVQGGGQVGAVRFPQPGRIERVAAGAAILAAARPLDRVHQRERVEGRGGLQLQLGEVRQWVERGRTGGSGSGPGQVGAAAQPLRVVDQIRIVAGERVRRRDEARAGRDQAAAAVVVRRRVGQVEGLTDVITSTWFGVFVSVIGMCRNRTSRNSMISRMNSISMTRAALSPMIWRFSIANPMSRIATCSVKFASANSLESVSCALVSTSLLRFSKLPCSYTSTRWYALKCELFTSSFPFQYQLTVADGTAELRHSIVAFSPLYAWMKRRTGSISGLQAKSSTCSSPNVLSSTRSGPPAHVGAIGYGMLFSVSHSLAARSRQSHTHGFSCSSMPCSRLSVSIVFGRSSDSWLPFSLSECSEPSPSNACGAIVWMLQNDRSSLVSAVTFRNAWLSIFWMWLRASVRSRSDTMCWNAADGTAVSRLTDRSSSTRLVRPANAPSSIWPMRQSRMYSFCRFSRFDRTNVSFEMICRLLPDTSSTCVEWSMFSGIVNRLPLRHSTACLPPFHLHWHADGQFGSPLAAASSSPNATSNAIVVRPEPPPLLRPLLCCFRRSAAIRNCCATAPGPATIEPLASIDCWW
uniref:Uncharacterized protein n=1 Tax=Anopheles atroparvus TaxID=41427 RepID=A0A182J4R5_ANOAO